MMQIPDLTFSDIHRANRSTNWDLKYLLYKGGSKAHTSHVNKMIDSGQLGNPIRNRLSLVIKIHQFIHGLLVEGGSAFTADNHIRFIRDMFIWADVSRQQLTIKTIQDVYLAWTDKLYSAGIIQKLNKSSLYTSASHAGAVIDGILGRPNPIISITKLKPAVRIKTALSISAEKQNLEDTFIFGHFLQDVCDALTVETVLRGPLPARIELRSGEILIERSRCKATDIKSFKKYESEGTLRTRSPLANRRCEAELLMFIAQTGMNFSEAIKLTLKSFSYATYLDGYLVRERKARRGGDVLFEIFKEYKPHFERYLEWRRILFPNSDLLFPFLQNGGKAFQKRPQFSFRYKCKAIGIPFIPPRKLRNTRVNWLLRRSDDPDLTAEMAQHSKQILLKVYEQPSQQRAMSEITRFWSKYDPTVSPTTPPAPGYCSGTPSPIESQIKNFPKPDCIRPSGCLWCEHHRDVDTQDYVWALASFRHLKIIELSKWNPPEKTRDTHPAQDVIDRITAKLIWFKSSNSLRSSWLDEALARIEEANYHPDWKRNITSIEGYQ